MTEQEAYEAVAAKLEKLSEYVRLGLFTPEETLGTISWIHESVDWKVWQESAAARINGYMQI